MAGKRKAKGKSKGRKKTKAKAARRVKKTRRAAPGKRKTARITAKKGGKGKGRKDKFSFNWQEVKTSEEWKSDWDDDAGDFEGDSGSSEY